VPGPAANAPAGAGVFSEGTRNENKVKERGDREKYKERCIYIDAASERKRRGGGRGEEGGGDGLRVRNAHRGRWPQQLRPPGLPG
jgi:hypothetical protein